MDATNLTADTFSHASNTQRENENAIFTSENQDKSDDLSDVLKYFTINEVKYSVSNSATASDAQGNFTHDPKTGTNTINWKEKVTNTRNGKLEQKY